MKLRSKIYLVLVAAAGVIVGCSSTKNNGSSSGDAGDGGQLAEAGVDAGGDGASSCTASDCTGSTPYCCTQVVIDDSGIVVVHKCQTPRCTGGIDNPQFCTTSAECPAGYTCGPNPLNNGSNFCMQLCKTSAQCLGVGDPCVASPLNDGSSICMTWRSYGDAGSSSASDAPTD